MKKLTTVQIKKWLEDISYCMDIPEVYLGTEINSYGSHGKGNYYKLWDDSTLRFLLSSAWSYKGAIGNQSFPLIYQFVNGYTRENGERPFIAERAYFPDSKKDLGHFVRHEIPVFGVESKHCMADFDLVGFSLGFVPLLSNIVKSLTVSGIPVKRKDREDMREKYPIIISGGTMYGNPEIFAVISDIVFIGEMEDEKDNPGLLAVLERIDEAKKREGFYTSDGRENLYYNLAKEFDFLYLPQLITPKYSKSFVLEGWDYKYTTIPERIKKRYVRDLDSVPTVLPVVSFHNPMMGTGEGEICRGCGAGACSFCAIGYRTKPYRERSVDFIINSVKHNVIYTGSESVFPTASEYTGYSKKKELTRRFMEEVSSNFDAQSQRVDSMAKDSEFSMLAGHGGMSQLAVGVEGSSERLRTFVNKGATEEIILQAVTNALKAGYQKIKLYFIANLPYESRDDINEMLELCDKIISLRDSMGSVAVIRCSWTPLLIEAWTPLQWEATTLEAKNLEGVCEILKEKGVYFTLGKKTEPNYMWSAQLIHLGDRIAGEALIDTYLEIDESYHGAVGKSVRSTLERKLKERGVSFEHYFKKKPDNYIFPWDIIDLGVKKSYILDIYRKGLAHIKRCEDSTYDKRGLYKNGLLVPKCFDTCTNCGGCQNEEDIKKVQAYSFNVKFDDSVDLQNIKLFDDAEIKQLLRFKVYTPVEMRFINNSYLKHVIRRACWLSNYSIAKKSIVFASRKLKYKAWFYGVDYIEFGMTKPIKDIQKFITDVNSNLSCYGLTILNGMEVSETFKRFGHSLYSVELSIDKYEALYRMKRIVDSSYIKAVIREDTYSVGLTRQHVNLKDYLRDIWIGRKNLNVALYIELSGKLSPYEALSSFLLTRGNVPFKSIIERHDTFFKEDNKEQDFFTPYCECGSKILITLMNEPYSEKCPACFHGGKFK